MPACCTRSRRPGRHPRILRANRRPRTSCRCLLIRSSFCFIVFFSLLLCLLRPRISRANRRLRASFGSASFCVWVLECAWFLRGAGLDLTMRWHFLQIGRLGKPQHAGKDLTTKYFPSYKTPLTQTYQNAQDIATLRRWHGELKTTYAQFGPLKNDD